MRELFREISKDQVDLFGLVLSSCGIPHEIKKGAAGWVLGVEDDDYGRGLQVIEEYLRENGPGAGENAGPRQHWDTSRAGLWMAGLLLGCHVAAILHTDRGALFREYGASAFHILQGQLYRTVTSLTLHANWFHLAGNLAGITLFGSAVCAVTGWGTGCLMILTSGMAGNLLNAFLHRTEHLAVGASTAVFGTVGILAVQQFMRKRKTPHGNIRAWVPMGAGLALLAFLGTGEKADLMAHLFGFLAGIGLGALEGLFFNRPKALGRQAFCLVLAISILGLAWMWPLFNL